MRYGAAFVYFTAITVAAAFAQTEDTEPTPPPMIGAPSSSEEAPEESLAPAEVAEPDPGGDIIKLKSGAELRGLQVLRETPTLFIVEIFEGVPPLEVPRRQVEEVIYDDIDPTTNRRTGTLAQETTVKDELLGTNIDPKLLDDPEFRQKLVADVSDPENPIKGKLLPAVLEELGNRIGLPITASPAVRKLPKAKLTWNTELEPGTSVVAVLGEDFQKQFPNLAVVYTKDGIQVVTKNQQEKLGKPDQSAEKTD